MRHELGLHHGARLVIRAAPAPQDGIDLVDEHDRGLQLLGEGEDGGDELVAVAVPFLGEGADVQVDEASAGFAGEGSGEQGFAAARGSIEEHTLRGGKEAGIAGEEAGEGEGVDDRLLQFLDDVVESADICNGRSS